MCSWIMASLGKNRVRCSLKVIVGNKTFPFDSGRRETAWLNGTYSELIYKEHNLCLFLVHVNNWVSI